jgi:hypothetical protein
MKYTLRRLITAQLIAALILVAIYLISRPLTPGNNPNAYNHIDLMLLIFLIPYALLSATNAIVFTVRLFASIKWKSINVSLFWFLAANILSWVALIVIPHIFPPVYQGI